MTTPQTSPQPSPRPAAPPVAPPHALSALALWRHEVRTRQRPRTLLDPLFRAACFELQADEQDALAQADEHLAARAATPTERTRWTRCAAVERRNAETLRQRAVEALVGLEEPGMAA